MIKLRRLEDGMFLTDLISRAFGEEINSHNFPSILSVQIIKDSLELLTNNLYEIIDETPEFIRDMI